MTGSVTNDTWIRLEKALSAERLAKYRQVKDLDSDTAVGRYLWNLELCASLYPVLHGVEVASRNRLDAVLTQRLGGRWLSNDLLLSGAEIQRVDDAKMKLAKRGVKDPTHSQLVAELSFGFWVGLFHKYYERHDRLWPRFSIDVMSGAPRAQRLRPTFYARMDEVRNLRNRAFHYEPLWYWQDLREQHDRALELLSWFSAETAEMVSRLDRFSGVLDRGEDAYECVLEGGWICPVHNAGCRYLRAGCSSAPPQPDENQSA